MTINLAGLRAELPVVNSVAYFTCNGLGPIPRRTRDACVEALDAYMQHGLMAHFQYTDVLATTREAAAKLIGAHASEIAFCRNTGHGILWAANAIAWEPGDEVVIPFRDYPAVVYPFKMLEARGRITLVMPEMEEPIPESRRLTLDVIRGAVTERTKAVAISWVQFDCGYRADLAAIGAFCRERGIYFIVDAIQGLGAVLLDVHRDHVDFLAAGGHKWMLGMQGTGIFFARGDVLDGLVPVNVNFAGMANSGGMDTDTHDYPMEMLPGAARFEEGSRNFIGIIGQRESLRLLLELGPDAIALRIKELTDYLCAGAEAAGCTILSDRRGDAWSGICLFTPPPWKDAAQIQTDCLANGILLNNHEGNIHMGVHCYNTHEELDRVLAFLR